MQLHTVEQMIDSFVLVPMLDLDAPVPQLVDRLVVVLQGLDMFTLVEQGIEVPKITLEDGIPQRAVLREPLPVEQLTDVPVPERVILARARSALGVVWNHVAARVEEGATGGCVAHPMSSGAPGSPGRYTNTGRRGEAEGSATDPGADSGGDVLVLMQLKFQQSESYLSVNVPQIQFVVRLFVFSCARDSSAVLGSGCCRARCATTR